MSRTVVLLIALGAGGVLVALWWAGDSCAESTDDPFVSVLMDRCGTAIRLDRELRAQPASKSIQRMLETLAASAEQVDDAGAKWQELEIIKLLDPEDHTAWKSLTQALATIWHPEYVDEITDERIDAAYGISLLPNPYRTSALLQVLAEKREPLALRNAVVEALEMNRSPEVISTLEEHWYADPGRFQVERGEPSLSGASLAMRQKSVKQLSQQHTVAADEALLAALKDPDPEVRASAAFALKGRENPKITDALVALISPSQDYTVVYKALAAIEGCPNYTFLRALLDTHQNGTDSVRGLVVPALVRCDDERVVAPIVASLDQRSSALGLAAANALATMAHRNHRTAVIPLQKALARDAIATADKAEIRRALERF